MSWIIFALLSAVFAALTAIFGKIGVANIDTTFATTMRAAIMTFFLVMATLLFGKQHLFTGIENKTWIFIIFSGISGALSWLCYYAALKSGPAASVVALDRLSVVFALLFAAAFLSEGITWKSAVGAVFMVFGAILMTIK